MERTYEDAERLLLSTQLTSTALQEHYNERHHTIDSMHNYIARLGLTPKAFASCKVIHVTGSKGKGSTCCFVESLSRQGFSTVLFTSPHLVRVTERIRLNGTPLSRDQWKKYFFHVWDRLHDPSVPPGGPSLTPSYFRLLTLLCLWVAVKEKIQVLILEVGVGGRFDATNVISRPVACGITALDLEHTELLGPTLTHIAEEKSGIIKPGTPVFVVPQEFEALNVLRASAAATQAPLYMVEPLSTTLDLRLGIAGDFQRSNAALAVALARSLRFEVDPRRDSRLASARGPEWLDLTQVVAEDADVKAGLECCTWPGRCQRVQWRLPKDKDHKAWWDLELFLDGAHTHQSMQATIRWFGEQHQAGRKCGLFFNCGAEKDVRSLFWHLISSWTGKGQDTFDFVCFYPPCTCRPTIAEPRTVRSLLMPQHMEAIAQQSSGHVLNSSALDASCTFLERQDRGMHAEDDTSAHLTWQQQLRQAWRVLHAAYILSMSSTQANQYTPCSAFKYVDTQTVVVVAAHQDEALEKLGHYLDTVQVEEAFEILATGSLYLVGDLLRHIENGSD